MGVLKKYFKIIFIGILVVVSICGCSNNEDIIKKIPEDEVLENINKNIIDRNSEFSIKYTQSTQSLKNAIDEYTKKLEGTDPYLKSSIVNFKWQTEEEKNKKVANFNIEYIENSEQEEEIKSKINDILEKNITESMSTTDKVRAIDSYIKNNVNVDDDLNNSSIYSALVDGKTNSIGFSRLAYRMLREVNIESKMINGKVYGNNHSWNLVNIDGTWLHLDITGDKLFKGKYFLITDDAIKDMGYHWE